ncbi:U3 small nucleolar RNA-associated protein 4 homolog [Episyrphus balteatus]|uniref:U3 small nucleolar RNA-associated protein 4 homolog n=1 Tax=Episyrphus balteatus TaxID=286459 RepID=UPI002486414E|nr:U3 small nucleolar RNA-associated protein 4 homolog [Episyrphus balteatus]
MKETNHEEDGITQIHNASFYNLTPRFITCMACNKINKKLAVSRNDGTIDIWDMQYASFHEKTIVTGESSIEGMAWAGNRLFTVGLTGHLLEWDLTTLTKHQSQTATGNSIWCLDVNTEGTLVALGTEEGYINIFDISDEQMAYSKLFDKQQGRILCCKFDSTAEHLVTGGIDAIRIWDVKTGHAIHRMSYARQKRAQEVIVWSLQVLKDMTIITGDSRGIVTVWDGKNAAHLEEHHVLKADVLAVAVNEEENKFICSGIDPKIRIYALTEIKKEDITMQNWIKYRQKQVHDHDVKALICMGDKIFSGGMDGYLGISSVDRTTSSGIAKHGPFLQGPAVCVSSEKRLLLLRYPNTVEIWKLGKSTGIEQIEDEEEEIKEEVKEDDYPPVEEKVFLKYEKGPQKLLEMRSKHGNQITCSSLSPDGNWLVYSTMTEIRMFAFMAGEENKMSQVVRIKCLPQEFTACKNILFSDDSKTLFLGKIDNTVEVFSILSNGEIDHSQTIKTSKYIKDTIHLVAVSNCGNYFVTAGTCRTIAVWIKKDKHFKHHLNLPRYTAPTTAISIHRDSPRLVASFSDSKIFEYDLEEMCFTCTEKDCYVKDSETHCVNSIVLDHRNPNMFILHNDTSLFVLEKCLPDAVGGGDDGVKKKKKLIESKVAGLKLKFQKKYQHFIHLAWLSIDELVAVGVNPISLIEQLPGAFVQKKFGAD